MPNHDHRRSLYFVHEEQRFDFLKEGRPHCRKKKKEKQKKNKRSVHSVRDQRSEIRAHFEQNNVNQISKQLVSQKYIFFHSPATDMLRFLHKILNFYFIIIIHNIQRRFSIINLS